MAKSVTVRGVTYPDVPFVRLPLSNGGGDADFYDISGATIDASKVLQGFSGFGPSGLVNGSYTPVNISQDSTTKVLSIS